MTTAVPTAEQTDAFLSAYFDAVLWANVSWDTATGEAPEGFSSSDIVLTDEQKAELAIDALDFLTANADDVASLDRFSFSLDPFSRSGHDFALTRNGHGAGFWDRGYGDVGDRLTDASHAYGAIEIYATVTDDKRILIDVN